MTQQSWLDGVRFGPDGLVPVVAQDAVTGRVLMVAWANREALTRTRESGSAHYFSRSRQALWRKGEQSGHAQQVDEVRLDCDGDTVLYRVRQEGPACHTGEATCFHRRVDGRGGLARQPDHSAHTLARLAAVVADRLGADPAGSYTARLLAQGLPAVAQKVGEEATETLVAALAQDDERVAAEAADLLYHLLVLLTARRVPLAAVVDELERRAH